MKSLKLFVLPISNFIVMVSFAIHPPTAIAQQRVTTVEEDRLDTLATVATEIYRSKDANRLYYTLLDQSKSDPTLKRAMELEEKLIQKQSQIDEKSARIETLQKQNNKNTAQKNKEIEQLKLQVQNLRAEQARLKKSKKALFAAKIAGAALTSVSLYFQIRNIKDSLRRVEIKQRDLLSRQNSLVTDKAKLNVLEGKVTDSKASLNSTRASSGVTAADIARAEKLLADAEIELTQWRDVVSRSQQKILDAEETAKIDQRAITRQKWSFGITAIGTLVIGLFGDKIILAVQEWLESDDTDTQVAAVYSYIQEWNAIKTPVVQASMLPTLKKAEMTPWQRSGVYFMTSEELGVNKGVVERALNRYKLKNPKGYERLQANAKSLLRYHLFRAFESNYWNMLEEEANRSREEREKLIPKALVRDHTNVVMPKIRPKSNYQKLYYQF
jgi:hypothetical protein